MNNLVTGLADVSVKKKLNKNYNVINFHTDCRRYLTCYANIFSVQNNEPTLLGFI